MTNLIFKLAGIGVTIQCDPSIDLEIVKGTFSSIKYRIAEEPFGRIVRVGKFNQTWSVWDADGELSLETKDTARFTHEVCHQIIENIADQSVSSFCIHAAAVSYNNKVVLLPGVSGAGKSSLTCWLVKNGFEYITDEFVAIDFFGNIEGLSRPIFIKKKGDFAIKPLVVNNEYVDIGNDITAYQSAAFGGRDAIQKSLRLGAILIPEFLNNSTHLLKKAGFSERGLSIMGSFLNARNFDKLGMKELMKFTSVPVLKLKYPDVVNMPTEHLDQLRQHLMA